MMALFDILAGREVRLNDGQWRELLSFADRTLSTPLLRGAGPGWLQVEVEARIGKIARRQARLREAYEDAARALACEGIEFVVLKGFTHEYAAPRAQNDIDLWVRDAAVAERVLTAAGFVRHRGGELSYNHTAPLLKPHSWQWRGDYFDPDMPVPVELHHTLWNEAWEKIAAPGLDEFWDRRVVDAGVPALARPDRLGFASLHLLRHVLRNNVRPAQAWELARWLESAGPELWEQMHRGHPPELRALEAIGLHLAARWFGPGVPVPVELPENAKTWFARYRMSPLENLVEPNKHALWLQLALIPRSWDRMAVAQRRLLPLRVPRPEEAVDASYARHLWDRVRFHAVALAGMGTRSSKARHTSD